MNDTMQQLMMQVSEQISSLKELSLRDVLYLVKTNWSRIVQIVPNTDLDSLARCICRATDKPEELEKWCQSLGPAAVELISILEGFSQGKSLARMQKESFSAVERAIIRNWGQLRKLWPLKRKDLIRFSNHLLHAELDDQQEVVRLQLEGRGEWQFFVAELLPCLKGNGLNIDFEMEKWIMSIPEAASDLPEIPALLSIGQEDFNEEKPRLAYGVWSRLRRNQYLRRMTKKGGLEKDELAKSLKTLEAAIFVYLHGCKWDNLPSEYGYWKDHYDSFQIWQATGMWKHIVVFLCGFLRAPDQRRSRYVPQSEIEEAIGAEWEGLKSSSPIQDKELLCRVVYQLLNYGQLSYKDQERVGEELKEWRKDGTWRCFTDHLIPILVRDCDICPEQRKLMQGQKIDEEEMLSELRERKRSIERKFPMNPKELTCLLEKYWSKIEPIVARAGVPVVKKRVLHNLRGILRVRLCDESWSLLNPTWGNGLVCQQQLLEWQEVGIWDELVKVLLPPLEDLYPDLPQRSKEALRSDKSHQATSQPNIAAATPRELNNLLILNKEKLASFGVKQTGKLAGIVWKLANGQPWEALPAKGHGSLSKYRRELDRLLKEQQWRNLTSILLPILKKHYQFTDEQIQALYAPGDPYAEEGTSLDIGITKEAVERSRSYCEQQSYLADEIRADFPEFFRLDDAHRLLSGVEVGDIKENPNSSFPTISLTVKKEEGNKQPCSKCGLTQYTRWSGNARHRTLVPNYASQGVGAGVRYYFQTKRMICKNPLCAEDRGGKKPYRPRWLWKLPESFIRPRHKYTRAAENGMAREALVVACRSANSSSLNKIPTRTVYRKKIEFLRQVMPFLEHALFQEAIEMGNELKLGIDDMSIRRGQRYQTVLYNLTNGTLLCVVEGRTREELAENLNSKYGYWLKQMNPQVIAMDGAPVYRKWAQEVFGEDVNIVMDRFHVAQWMSEDLREVNRLMAPYRSPIAKAARKGNRYLLRNNPEHMTEGQRCSLQIVLDDCEVLRLMHSFKWELWAWYERRDLVSYDEANAALGALLSRVENALKRIEEGLPGMTEKRARLTEEAVQVIRRRLNSLGNRRKELVGYHVYKRITNGFVEGKNRRTRVLQSRSYGIPNAEVRRMSISVDCNHSRIEQLFSS